MWFLNPDLFKLILQYLQIHIKTMDGNIANHAFLNTWLSEVCGHFLLYFLLLDIQLCVCLHM